MNLERNWRLIAALLAVVPLHAAVYNVSLSTSLLSNGNYSFDFQFINNDSASGNNTGTISNIVMSGLTGATLFTSGGVSGSIATGLSLTDSATTDARIDFTKNADPLTLSFLMSYSGNYTAPGAGDTFSFTILDSLGFPIRSAGSGNLAEVVITSAASQLLPFPSDPQNQNLDTVIPQITNTDVPEPATLGLVVAGVAFAALRRRRS